MTLIALQNKSSLLPTSFHRAHFEAMAAACTYQLRHHVAPIWGRYSQHVEFVEDNAVLSSAVHPIYLLDDADQAGALGYHTEDPDGRVYGRVFLRDLLTHGGSVLSGSLSVSAVLSHEVCEMFNDPNVNMWADTGQSKAIALELCDPVESDSYEIELPDGAVSVSNFVTPSYFDPQAPARSQFDYMSKLAAPFTMTKGGYLVVEQEGKVSAVYGDEMPDWKKAAKQTEGARTFHRLVARKPAPLVMQVQGIVSGEHLGKI